MIEMSAAASPASASSGAVLVAVPAETGADGAATQGFSAVLADASAPTLTTVAPDFAAILPDKTGMIGNLAGNPTGKTLPVGKGEGAATSEDAMDDEASEAQIAPPSMALAFLPPFVTAAASTPGAVKTTAAQLMAQVPAKALGDKQTSDMPAKPDHAARAAAEPVAPQPTAAEHKAAAEHKVVTTALTEVATAPRTDAIAPLALAEIRNATAMPATTPAPAGTPTQDIATLVDRIAEARAAAAPDTVRAALMHEEFGSVSLRFRADNSHIQVTLGSADPGFAPAVHAAAAASQAANTAGDPDRRDQPTHQRADAQTNQPTQQQPAQQQASRDRAGADRAADRDAALGRTVRGKPEGNDTSSEPLRRSGIYA